MRTNTLRFVYIVYIAFLKLVRYTNQNLVS